MGKNKDILHIIPIPNKEPKADDILGYEIVPKLYGTTFICAPKGSGKTTVLWHILKNCANKHTYVYIFSNTVYSDANWDYIIEKMTKKKINHSVACDTEDLSNIINSLAGAGASPLPPPFGARAGAEPPQESAIPGAPLTNAKLEIDRWSKFNKAGTRLEFMKKGRE